jgi:hypothetical protein
MLSFSAPGATRAHALRCAPARTGISKICSFFAVQVMT